MLCPWAVSLFQKLCPAPFSPVTGLPSHRRVARRAGQEAKEGDTGMCAFVSLQLCIWAQWEESTSLPLSEWVPDQVFVWRSWFVKSCLTLCDPMDCSTSGVPVLHHLLELAQTHVHWVGDAIQPSHPLSSPSPTALIFPSIRVFSNESALCIRSQSIGASASASVLPMNIQDWFPLGLIGLILQSKELSRVFSNTTVQKHQFFCTQPSLWSNSHMTLWPNYTWLLEGDELLTEELWTIELQVWEQTLALLDSFFWQWGAVGPWFCHHLIQSVFLHTLHGFEKLCHFWTCGSCGVDLRSRSWSFNFRKQWGIKQCLNPL